MGDFFPNLIPNTGEGHENAGEGRAPSSAASNYETQIRYWCEAAYQEAKKITDDSKEIQEVDKTLDYLAGLQWKGATPSHSAKPVINRMLRMFWETVGQLTDIRPIFEVHATAKGEAYSKTQDILNRLARAWAIETNFDLSMAFVLIYGMITTGYAKVEWDPFALNGQGDIAVKAISPNGLLVLGAENNLQEAECVIYRQVKTLNWIRRKHPTTGYAVRPDVTYSKYDLSAAAPAHVSPQLFMSLSPGMRRKISSQPEVQPSVYPKAEYREFWLRDSSVNNGEKPVLMGRAGTNWCYTVQPGDPLYPRGRVITMANSVILDDQPNPYWHGKFPFAMVRLNAVPWQFHGMSVVKPWMTMQDVINQIIAGVLNMVKLAINPPLLAPKNAFSVEAWKSLNTSRPNEKAQYSGNVSYKPEFRRPPEVPAYVLALNNMVSAEMDMSSGAAAMADAAKKKQVPSGDSLDQIQQARNTPIRMMGRNIEGFISDLGFLFIPCLLQFYTAERRTDLLGTAGLTPADYDASPGTLVPHGMEPEAYARKFKFRIERGSLLSTQRLERINYAIRLFSMKAMSLQQLYRILDLNINVDKMIGEMVEEAKLVQAIAPPKGKQQKKAA